MNNCGECLRACLSVMAWKITHMVLILVSLKALIGVAFVLFVCCQVGLPCQLKIKKKGNGDWVSMILLPARNFLHPTVFNTSFSFNPSRIGERYIPNETGKGKLFVSGASFFFLYCSTIERVRVVLREGCGGAQMGTRNEHSQTQIYPR